MELVDFLVQTQEEVRRAVEEPDPDPGASSPYQETIFAEIVMQHMFDIGMSFEPNPCHYQGQYGRSYIKLSGYALSEEADQLDLFVCLYSGTMEIESISDTETKTAADQCLRFLIKCVESDLASYLGEENDAYALARTINGGYAELDQIRIFVLTDRKAKTKNYQSREIAGKTVKLEVMDIERLHRHWSEGRPRDEITVDFNHVTGGPLPCVLIGGDEQRCDFALTAIPGTALFHIYEKYGARLLEANVRSFLSATGKVNKGIRDTIREHPENFMAYNNGIVIVADDIRTATRDGILGITWLCGVQIVNGGQTTASLYFTKKKYANTDLSRIAVPAKIIIMKADLGKEEEQLISNISRFSNSQNSVRTSDLSANKPYHVEIEKLSNTVYCPDGQGRWFYERASGSYRTMLLREGSTPTRLRAMRTTVVPNSRKITKTDLAKYLNAWNMKPAAVSLGAQKNFELFMQDLTASEDAGITIIPDVAGYKRIIAKAILYKKAQALIRPSFPAFQANITTYTVSLISNRFGDRIDLDMIWTNQDISMGLKNLVVIWAAEVYHVLQTTSNGRMISEYAKKNPCWEAVATARYSDPADVIPELKNLSTAGQSRRRAII